MKKLIAATAVVVGLAFTAGTAIAFQCPSLIKQGRDEAANIDANSDKAKKAASMLDKAEALQKEGQHVDSGTEANEALGLLGRKQESRRQVSGYPWLYG